MGVGERWRARRPKTLAENVNVEKFTYLCTRLPPNKIK